MKIQDTYYDHAGWRLFHDGWLLGFADTYGAYDYAYAIQINGCWRAL